MPQRSAAGPAAWCPCSRVSIQGVGLAQYFYQSVCIPANISHNSFAGPVRLFFEGCFQLSVAAEGHEGAEGPLMQAPPPTPALANPRVGV